MHACVRACMRVCMSVCVCDGYGRLSGVYVMQ